MSLYQDPDVLEATPFFGSLYDVFISTVARPSTATAPTTTKCPTLFFNAVHDVLTGASDGQTAVANRSCLKTCSGLEDGAP